MPSKPDLNRKSKRSSKSMQPQKRWPTEKLKKIISIGRQRRK